MDNESLYNKSLLNDLNNIKSKLKYNFYFLIFLTLCIGLLSYISLTSGFTHLSLINKILKIIGLCIQLFLWFKLIKEFCRFVYSFCIIKFCKEIYEKESNPED